MGATVSIPDRPDGGSTKRRMIRWWIVGTAFAVLGFPLLYLLVNVEGMPLSIASLSTAEITLIIRFFVNDRWVFQQRSWSWTRLWRFQVTGVGAIVIWWSVTNALPQVGIHYLLASLVGTGCSVICSMVTNFRWIWQQPSAAANEQEFDRPVPDLLS